MTYPDGISVDAFASMDGGCAMKWDVACGEAELILGTRMRSITLVLDEDALDKLAAETAHALIQLRATKPAVRK